MGAVSSDVGVARQPRLSPSSAPFYKPLSQACRGPSVTNLRRGPLCTILRSSMGRVCHTTPRFCYKPCRKIASRTCYKPDVFGLQPYATSLEVLIRGSLSSLPLAYLAELCKTNRDRLASQKFKAQEIAPRNSQDRKS